MQVISFLAVDECGGPVICNSKMQGLGHDEHGVNTKLVAAQVHFANSVKEAALAAYKLVAHKDCALLASCDMTGSYILQYELESGDTYCNVFVTKQMLVGLDFINAAAAATQSLLCKVHSNVQTWGIEISSS